MENNRIPCRIIGFGKDDASEERAGYKIYIPSTNSTDWSMDVVIDWDTPLSALPSNIRPSVQDIDNLYNDPTFQPHDLEESDLDSLTGDFYTADNNSDDGLSIDTISVGENDQDIIPVDNNPLVSAVDMHVPEPRYPRRSRTENVNYTEPEDEDLENSAFVVSIEQIIQLHAPTDVVEFLAFGVQDVMFIPNNHSQAMACKESKFWRAAESKELASHKSNKTFGKAKMTVRGRRPVKSRWVYTKKFDEKV